MLALGSSPGEWAIRAERAYGEISPGGDYLSVNFEADPVHCRIMEDYFANNEADTEKNIIVYGAVAAIDGWASMPIVHQNNWGAGIAALSTDKGAKGDLPEHERVSQLAGLGTAELKYEASWHFRWMGSSSASDTSSFCTVISRGLKRRVFRPT